MEYRIVVGPYTAFLHRCWPTEDKLSFVSMCVAAGTVEALVARVDAPVTIVTAHRR
jgi:hypothetical protein